MPSYSSDLAHLSFRISAIFSSTDVEVQAIEAYFQRDMKVPSS